MLSAERQRNECALFRYCCSTINSFSLFFFLSFSPSFPLCFSLSFCSAFYLGHLQMYPYSVSDSRCWVLKIIKMTFVMWQFNVGLQIPPNKNVTKTHPRKCGLQFFLSFLSAFIAIAIATAIAVNILLWNFNLDEINIKNVIRNSENV